MEARCKALSLIAEVPVVQSSSDATAALPSVYDSVKHALQRLIPTQKLAQRCILNNLGVKLEPGTITLVLGQPRPGKTSLLKLLSGQFPMEKNVVVEEDISYNGMPQLAAYVPQTDKHFPSLSVQETLILHMNAQ